MEPLNSTFFCNTTGYLVAQSLQVVAAHIHTAHAHSALSGVIQTGDELDQRGFGRARAADNADGLAGTNVQVNAGKRHALRPSLRT